MEKTSLVSSNAAARYLEIPMIALGQLVFDGLLHPEGISFHKEELDYVKENVDLTQYR